MERINKIEIGVILTVILAIIGFAFWLGGINNSVLQLDKRMEKIEQRLSKLDSASTYSAFVVKKEKEDKKITSTDANTLSKSFDLEPEVAERMHQAFAIGFFGMHHILAVIQGDMERISSSRKLIILMLGHLGIKPKFYREYVNTEETDLGVLKPFFYTVAPNELEKIHGKRIRWMLEFGIKLTTIQLTLNGYNESDKPEKISWRMKQVSEELPEAIVAAKRANVPKKILLELDKIQQQINKSKSRASLKKCLEIVDPIVENITITKKAVNYLTQ